MNKILLFVITLTLSSCSLFKGGASKNTSSSQITGKKRYKLTDKAGDFLVYRESGFKGGNKSFITKREVFPFNDDKSKVLEQSVAISTVGKVGKDLTIMRPDQSQYTVWFDGKKYVARMKLNKQSQLFEVRLTSPEKQWSGKTTHKFPDTRSVYCFYSQVVECAMITGFIKKAMKVSKGSMNLYIVWDGYPYFQEQYLDIPSGVFTKAKITYDGKTQTGESRFSLSFGNQVIFYMFDKELSYTKKYWVSQGLTMIKNEK